MKKNTNCTKTTELTKPETTIEYDIHATLVIDDEIGKLEAGDILHDVLNGAFDDYQLKGVKCFFKEVNA